MIRALALAAALALPLTAHAGSISFTITSTSPAINATKTFTVPDAHIARLIAVMQAIYAPAPPAAGLTANQALNAMVSGVMQGWINAVLQAEQQSAASTATAGVTPITAQ